nr:Gfo/Idh/MocA family oxidoreductase [Streptomyces natalensis]
MAEDHRRTAAIRTTRWLVHETGLIGTPELIQAQRVRYEPNPTRTGWRTQRALGGGGWAIDNGAHLIDSLAYIVGPLSSVTAVAKRLHNTPVFHANGDTRIDEREDFLSALMTFESGTTGIFSCVSSLPHADDFSFALRGTTGAIVDDGGQLFHAPLPEARVHARGGNRRSLRDFHKDFLASLSPREHEKYFPFGLTHGFAIECAEFLLAIRDGAQVEIGADTALNTLATSLAFYESAIAGRTVSVTEVLNGSLSEYQKTIKVGPLESDFKRV